MGWAILIIGAILIVAGLVVVFTAPKPALPQAEAETEGLGDVANILKELNALLDKFDGRLRLGVLLIVLGTGLVGLAGFVEGKQAKDDAKDTGLVVHVRSLG